MRAFNADLPYNQFVTEHIAGDLLEEPRLDPATGMNESVVATGSWWLGEATHAPTDVRGDEAMRIDNQIDVFSKSFLGLTVSCARCHDHKFDAISTKDYYALAGYLQSSRRQLAMLDPGGRIAAGAAELRSIQAEASESLGPRAPGAPAAFRPEDDRVVRRRDAGGVEHEGRGVSGSARPGLSAGRWCWGTRPGRWRPGGCCTAGSTGASCTGCCGRRPSRWRSRRSTCGWPGTGAVEVRVVIDGYFMQEYNALLFNGTHLKGKGLKTDGKYEWKTLGGDLRKYVGRTVYLEFIDKGDGYLAVDEVAYDKRNGAGTGRPGRQCAAAPGLERISRGPRTVEQAVPAPAYTLAMADGTPEDERVHIRGRARQPRGGGAAALSDRLGGRGRRMPTWRAAASTWHGRSCRRTTR